MNTNQTINRKLKEISALQKDLIALAKQIVLPEIKKKYPEYYVQLTPGFEDNRTMNIEIYNVPSSKCDSVDRWIYNFVHEKVTDKLLFLVFSHSVECTKQHYPQYLNIVNV